MVVRGWRRGGMLAVGLSGCLGPAVIDRDDTTTTTTDDATSGSNVTSDPIETTVVPGDDSGESSGTPGESSTGSDDPSCGFLCEPDGGDTQFECDTWAQDCPRGLKCMPWA